MVDVQNATLAGGVAIGSAANLTVLSPAESLVIGVLGGTLSVVGYTKIQPKIERHLLVHDTCGVNNLHGMPAILAGIASAIIIAYSGDQTTFTRQTSSAAYNETYGNINGRTPGEQAGVQLLCVLISFSMAVVSGTLCGLVCKLLGSPEEDGLFLDRGYWEVPNMELPFYFDKRGEINREMAEAAALDASKHGGAPALDGSKHGSPLQAHALVRRAARASKDRERRPSKEGPHAHEYSGYMTAGGSQPAMTSSSPGPVPSLISNELINMKLDLMLQHQMRMFPPPSSSLTEAEEREKQHRMRTLPLPSSSSLAEAHMPQPAAPMELCSPAGPSEAEEREKV